MKMVITYSAKCKDCIFRKDFYHGRKKGSRCMAAAPERRPAIEDKIVTLRTPACDNFRLT